MAFGIDDAIVEVAAEAAKEGASEVTSSSSGILENVSENSLSSEFSPDVFSENVYDSNLGDLQAEPESLNVGEETFNPSAIE